MTKKGPFFWFSQCGMSVSHEIWCVDWVEFWLMFLLVQSCFSVVSCQRSRDVWWVKLVRQIIFEAETFCAILAYSLWTDLVKDRMCLLYVDNEGTKFSLMKGMSENLVVAAMAQVFAELETHVHTLCWISRVSSFSNVADAP